MQAGNVFTLSEVLDQYGQQASIARATGVTRSSVQQWVRGAATPSGPSLVALTDYLRRYVPTATEREVLEELARRQAARAQSNGSTRENNS